MSIKHPLAPQPRPGHEFATLGGGCFWCLEAVYEELVGVVDVESGYAGGQAAAPTYEQVCGGRTGHAEVVRIEFDPGAHRVPRDPRGVLRDPRSDAAQPAGQRRRHAVPLGDLRALGRAAPRGRRGHRRTAVAGAGKVVTEVLPVPAYYRAETYHQEYFRHNAGQGYCMFVVAPKVAKFRKTFASKRRT